MKITIPNWTLQDSFPSKDQPPRLEYIQESLKEFAKSKLLVPIASKITKNMAAIELAIVEYQKTRISIAESLCDRDDKGKPVTEKNVYKFSDEGYKEFVDKWNELLNTNIEVEIHQINESDIEKLEINGTCYQTLMKYGFIKEKEDAPDKVKQNGQADKKELSAVN